MDACDAQAFAQAEASLLSLGHELHKLDSAKFDLDNMRRLLAAVGKPQDDFPAVLVAGTNGKGSTSAMLSSMLREAGLRTGLYTSPHLVSMRERIRVDGRLIAPADFARAHAAIRTAAEKLVEEKRLPHLPSFFEMLTAMAFLHFSTEAVDIAVLEVGMGGRLDATNVVAPRLSIITDIGLDHEKFLGSTLSAIAGEKAGILRAGAPAVTLRQCSEVDAVLDGEMERLGSLPCPADETLSAIRARHDELTPFLRGAHQQRNLALAVAAAEALARQGFAVDAEAIARGARKAHWPARLQQIAATSQRPALLIDVAHNPAGAQVLRAALDELYGARARVFVFGALRDKSYAAMAGILFRAGDKVFTSACGDNPRTAGAEETAAAARTAGAWAQPCSSVAQAIDAACAAAKKNDEDAIVTLCGSIYMAGEAIQALGLAEESEDERRWHDKKTR